ncbi:MAG: DUF3499 domain-containing protein, partial [Propionibacteriaceae bacterium]|nr:DUF3499 domain-containing protein [Propionibacteriaceae bacterium]
MLCARTTCTAPAVATVSMEYGKSRLVIDELAAEPQPGTYDLCLEHARKLTAPQNWEVVQIGHLSAPILSDSSIEALAEAIRRVGEADDIAADAPRPI